MILAVDLPVINKRIRLIRMFNVANQITAHTPVGMKQIDTSGMTSGDVAIIRIAGYTIMPANGPVALIADVGSITLPNVCNIKFL